MKAKHLVVISLDSLSSHDFEAAVRLPNLGKLIREGSCIREVRGIYPTQTYPLHASIVTGTYPATHGVISNTRFDPGNPDPEWHWFRRDLRVPALYDAAREHGIDTAAFLWPVSGGARIKYNLPEIEPKKRGQNQTLLVLRNGTPLFLLGLRRRFGHLLRGTERASLDDFTSHSAAWTIERKRPGLVLIHLLDLDHQRHETGFMNATVARTLEEEDERIGTLLEAVESAGLADETAVVVIGDHSQKDVGKMVRLNAMFRDAGFIETDGNGKVRSWKAWCNACDGSAHIYTADTETARAVRILAESLGDGGRKIVREVFSREEAVRLHVGPRPDLILEAEDGYYFSSELAGDPLAEPEHLATHGYLPERYSSLMIARGPGIAGGQELQHGRIVDVGPSLARMLGIPLPHAEGEAIEALFT